jgi:hypothetical protein
MLAVSLLYGGVECGVWCQFFNNNQCALSGLPFFSSSLRSSCFVSPYKYFALHLRTHPAHSAGRKRVIDSDSDEFDDPNMTEDEEAAMDFLYASHADPPSQLEDDEEVHASESESDDQVKRTVKTSCVDSFVSCFCLFVFLSVFFSSRLWSLSHFAIPMFSTCGVFLFFFLFFLFSLLLLFSPVRRHCCPLATPLVQVLDVAPAKLLHVYQSKNWPNGTG